MIPAWCANRGWIHQLCSVSVAQDLSVDTYSPALKPRSPCLWDALGWIFSGQCSAHLLRSDFMTVSREYWNERTSLTSSVCSLTLAMPSSRPPRPYKNGWRSSKRPNRLFHIVMISSQSSQSRLGQRVAIPAISFTALCMPVARRSSAVIEVDWRRATKSPCRVRTSSGRRISGPSRATRTSRSSRIQCAKCLSL